MSHVLKRFAIILFFSVLSAQFVYAIEIDENYKGYVSDKRAVTVGDTLTLFVIENSSASTAKGSNSGRDFSLSGGYTTTTDSENASVGVTYNNDADKGRQHAGSLKAAITATVVEKSETNMLKVLGSQEIIVDGEKQVITVSGWARPTDISRDNTLVSTRLSEAFIEYTGFENKKTSFWAKLFGKTNKEDEK